MLRIALVVFEEVIVITWRYMPCLSSFIILFLFVTRVCGRRLKPFEANMIYDVVRYIKKTIDLT